jgi:hypothetical protein
MDDSKEPIGQQEWEEFTSPDQEWRPAVQRPVRVQARKVTGQPEDLEIGGRVVTVHPGDWIVRFPEGTTKPFRKEEFETLFALARSRDENEGLEETPGMSI